MIDAAVGASAHRVIAVVPWFGYSRQDKKSAPREPISARLVARMIEAAGADRVLTMDLHAGQVQGFFSKPVDHMTARFILAQHFNDQHLDNLVVVAPDVGRAKLAQKFAENVGADLAVMIKDRPDQQVAEIGYVIGDVRGKNAIIVDDIIDTAGTLPPPPRRCVSRARARLRRRDPRSLLRRGVREHRACQPRAGGRHGHDSARPGRASQDASTPLRGHADRLDPPDLHRRIGQRGVRRREPALLTRPARGAQRAPAPQRGGDARHLQARRALGDRWPIRPPARG